MDEKPKESDDKKWLLWSVLYAAIYLALAGYLSYTVPYSSGPVTNLTLLLLILWGLLYLPIFFLPTAARWKVTDFGFTLNPLLALAFIIITMLCAFFSMAARITWGSAVIEAFARTGEEVFFCGFLFIIFTRLFDNKRRPWLWATIASSILFALVHTQTFQQSFLSQSGSPSVPVVYTIVVRLINVFALGFVFALLRVWTQSILPGAIAHSIINNGIQALPFVLVIYFLVIFWAYRRGEQITL